MRRRWPLDPLAYKLIVGKALVRILGLDTGQTHWSDSGFVYSPVTVVDPYLLAGVSADQPAGMTV